MSSMIFSKWMFFAGVLILLSSLVWADTASCSQDSFRKACNSCNFDASGKMDQQCWKKYEQEGTSCVAKEYPITAGLYSQGDCQEIDKCASQLKACTSAASSGSDKTDCSTRAVKDCYWYADQCVKKAENKCNPLDIPPCSLSMILLFVVMVSITVYSSSRKKFR